MAKGAKQQETIVGIDASKLSETAMTEAAAKLGIRFPGGASAIAMAKALQGYFETSGGDLAPCDNCGGLSPTDTLDRCPFCGEGDGQAAGDEGEPDDRADDLKPSTALAPVRSAPEVKEGVLEYPAPAPDLDKSVATIKRLQLEGVRCLWDIAGELAEIAQSQSFKQRQSADGKTAYRTLEQFAETELGYGRKYVQDLIKARAGFDKRTFSEIGPTKLRLVWQTPPDRQETILDKLKSGAPRSEVVKDVQEARAAAGSKDSRGQAPKKQKPAANVGERKTITIAQIEGKKTIPLYKKPAGKITIDGAERATKIEQTPFGMLDLANDVRMWITIMKHPASGELTARIEFRRIDPK